MAGRAGHAGADLLRLHLRDEGYEVCHCANGDLGLQQLRQGGWDALILDLMLPGVDGLEICRQARAMPTYTPIIITSARQRSAPHSRALCFALR